MEVKWKSFRIGPNEGAWEPASYNIRTPDGHEYGRWRRVLRKHPHGLTVISHYTAPPGKAWKIIGKASELGEEVLILDGPITMHAVISSQDQEHSCSTRRVHGTEESRVT